MQKHLNPTWKRAWQIAKILIRYLLGRFMQSTGLQRLLSHPLPAPKSEPELLRDLLQDLGGSFIKLGQMLALQTDLLSREYCHAFDDLLDRVPPLSYDQVENVIAAELGQSPNEIFDDFTSTSIASASIGQVHMGRLAGKRLAIKVQRPTAEQQFGGDLRIMEWMVILIRRARLKKLYFLVNPLMECIELTAEELDYRQEARTLQAFRHGSQIRPYEYVPAIIERYSTRRILVMEFLEGVTFLDYLRAAENNDKSFLRKLSNKGFVVETFIERLIDNFLHQAFVNGLFHADLHPANLMILPGNTVGYIDFGITGRLSPYSRRKLMEMTLAYTRGDIDAMGSAFNGLSVADEMVAERFTAGLLDLATDWYEKSSGILHLRKPITSIMLDMLRLSYATGAWGQRDIIKYIRSCITLDGLVRRSLPNIDLGQFLQPSCSRHVPRMGHSATDLLTASSAGIRRMLMNSSRVTALLSRRIDQRPRVDLKLEPSRPKQDMFHPSTAAAPVLLALLIAAKMQDTNPPEILGINLLTAQVLLLLASLGWLLMSRIRRPRAKSL